MASTDHSINRSPRAGPSGAASSVRPSRHTPAVPADLRGDGGGTAGVCDGWVVAWWPAFTRRAADSAATPRPVPRPPQPCAASGTAGHVWHDLLWLASSSSSHREPHQERSQRGDPLLVCRGLVCLADDRPSSYLRTPLLPGRGPRTRRGPATPTPRVGLTAGPPNVDRQFDTVAQRDAIATPPQGGHDDHAARR